MARSDDVKILKQRSAEDLKVAEMIVDNDDEMIAHIGFNLQQFLEKKMKASLYENGIDYPKTHDLAALLKLFPQKRVGEKEKMFAYILSQYAVESRYSDDPLPPLDGQQLLSETKKFAEFIETLWN